MTLNNSLADIRHSEFSAAAANNSFEFNPYIQKKCDETISKFVPPLAERSKYGGPSYMSSNKDYGNFVESLKIDELLKNVRQMRL